MTIEEFMAELRRTERMKESDVFMMMVLDPEKLYRTFLTVKSTLEPDPEVRAMQEDLERSIARMRENQKSMAAYYAMESFPDSYAVVRSIKRAMEGSPLSIEELYEEESSRSGAGEDHDEDEFDGEGEYVGEEDYDDCDEDYDDGDYEEDGE